MEASARNGAVEGQVSVIGEGIAVHGNIEASVDLQIEGKVVGDVRCGTLLLGERAQINGNVRADRVRVAGTIEGSVETGDIALEATARVAGDLSYSRIRIANGAIVEGRLTHVAREELAETGGLRLVDSPQPQPQPQTQAARAQGAGHKPIYIE
jgi:cytoskeletal protein CcmA (bactofilin family)